MSNDLLTGFHHVATVTHDLDRLVAFYTEVFDATTLFDLVAPGLDVRHVALDVGGGAFLHAWQVDADATGPFPQEMFRRGRLDHLGLAVRDEAALDLYRQRLVEHGACDGTVTDFGSGLSVWFTDPDGMELEICCLKPGASISDTGDPRPTTKATW